MSDNDIKSAFINFIDTVRRVRKDCPWDKIQTHSSLRAALIEETYEVIETIDNGHISELRKELGDLLLHIVFHSIVAEEESAFTIEEVIRSIDHKIISRHPHIFGDTKVDNAEEVKQNWEKIKLAEGRSSVLDGIPYSMPALQRAYRMQERAASTGFDWDDTADVLAKVVEEIAEFESETDTFKKEEEFGDILFSLVNYARHHKIDPEEALRRSSNKFQNRFKSMETSIRKEQKDIYSLSLEVLDLYWVRAKQE